MTDKRMAQIPEFYVRPILYVADVSLSTAYYCEKLEFEKDWGDDVFAQVSILDLELLIRCAKTLDMPKSRSTISVSMHVPSKLNDLYENLIRSGAQIVNPPHEVDWQKATYELLLEDLDGNVLLFWAAMGDT
tara:strand:- start:103 stop:498 length:396 start_codon:yes stop_codon:yes gene_type:complete